jgi:hypothetical protein
VKLYALGDTLPMYARVSALQGLLNSKEALARATPEAVRVGALECLSALFLSHGRQLAGSISESVSIAAKHAAK